LRSATERSAFAHLLSLRDDRAAGRRERLSEADPVITSPIWLILGLGGIVAVLLGLVFSDRRERFLVQASLMAAFTTVVASGLILVWSLDDPYRDTTGSIRPVEMQRSIAIMQEHRPSLVLPCTSGGDPRPS
jgi:undecaprenyl pyrophosphate phosphatase UppP